MINLQNVIYQHKRTNFKISIPNEKISGPGVTAIIGSNGAGKSTILKLLSGLIRPSNGHVLFDEQDVFLKFEDIKNFVHLISGQINLYTHLTIEQHIQLLKKISQKWDEEVENKLFEVFGLNKGTQISRLSNGQLVMLKILLSMCRMPKLLLIDEVTNDLDHTTREYIYQALDEYTYQNEAQVFIATNIIEDMERYATNIIFVKNGVIIENETLDKLKEKHQLSLDEIYKKLSE